jgi:hypothetical protein
MLVNTPKIVVWCFQIGVFPEQLTSSALFMTGSVALRGCQINVVALEEGLFNAVVTSQGLRAAPQR